MDLPGQNGGLSIVKCEFSWKFKHGKSVISQSKWHFSPGKLGDKQAKFGDDRRTDWDRTNERKKMGAYPQTPNLQDGAPQL